MPRGRKVNSSGEKSKQLLLEKAIELFSTHGYHETKISDIVKAANLTQPTFYLYFQSKESLYKDLNELFQDNFFAIIQQDFNGTSSEENEMDQIRLLLTNIFEYFVQNPNLTKIGFFDSEEANATKEKFSINLMMKLNYLNSIHEQQVDSKVLAYSLLGTVERLTLSALLTNLRSPAQLASDVVNIYFVNRKELVR